MKHSIMNLDARYCVWPAFGGGVWRVILDGKVVSYHSSKQKAQDAARAHAAMYNYNESKEAN